MFHYLTDTLGIVTWEQIFWTCVSHTDICFFISPVGTISSAITYLWHHNILSDLLKQSYLNLILTFSLRTHCWSPQSQPPPPQLHMYPGIPMVNIKHNDIHIMPSLYFTIPIEFNLSTFQLSNSVVIAAASLSASFYSTFLWSTWVSCLCPFHTFLEENTTFFWGFHIFLLV